MTGSPAGDLEIAVEHVNGIAVLGVSGELDIATAPELARVLEGAQFAAKGMALDFSGLRFIDSTGLHLLITARERAVRDDAPFVLVGCRDPVIRALRISGLQDAFTLAPDVEAVVDGTPG